MRKRRQQGTKARVTKIDWTGDDKRGKGERGEKKERQKDEKKKGKIESSNEEERRKENRRWRIVAQNVHGLNEEKSDNFAAALHTDWKEPDIVILSETWTTTATADYHSYKISEKAKKWQIMEKVMAEEEPRVGRTRGGQIIAVKKQHEVRRIETSGEMEEDVVAIEVTKGRAGEREEEKLIIISVYIRPSQRRREHQRRLEELKRIMEVGNRMRKEGRTVMIIGDINIDVNEEGRYKTRELKKVCEDLEWRITNRTGEHTYTGVGHGREKEGSTLDVAIVAKDMRERIKTRTIPHRKNKITERSDHKAIQVDIISEEEETKGKKKKKKKRKEKEGRQRRRLTADMLRTSKGYIDRERIEETGKCAEERNKKEGNKLRELYNILEDQRGMLLGRERDGNEEIEKKEDGEEKEPSEMKKRKWWKEKRKERRRIRIRLKAEREETSRIINDKTMNIRERYRAFASKTGVGKNKKEKRITMKEENGEEISTREICARFEENLKETMTSAGRGRRTRKQSQDREKEKEEKEKARTDNEGGEGLLEEKKEEEGEEDPEEQAFTIEEMAEAVGRMENGKATGEDGILTELLKYNHHRIQEKMLEIYNEWYDRGETDEGMNDAIIIPLLKEGKDPNKAESYRKVGLASMITRVYEKMIAQRIMDRTEENMAKYQHGFRTNMNTIDVLMILEETTRRRAEVGLKTYLAAVDLTTAYDVVDRNTLWIKCEKRCIRGKLLRAVQSLYEKVRVKVCVNGESSEQIENDIGVRQGGPASPILFNIYIEETIERLNKGEEEEWQTPTLAFADDITIEAGDPETLQEKLDILQESVEEIGQEINTGKTKIMTIGRDEKDEGREYTVEGTRIEEVSTQKILGMICTAKKGQLMMKRCDIGTLAKIRRRVGMMKRVQLQNGYEERNEMNIEALTNFHRTIIAPTYEYGAQLRTDKITKREWKAIENIQYEVALYILQITPDSRPSRAAVYKELGWTTVESRFKYLQCRWWKRLSDGNCGELVRECVERWREEEKEGRSKQRGRKSWWEVTERMMEDVAGPEKEAKEKVRGREIGEKGEMKEMAKQKWKRWLTECLKVREWEREEEKNKKKKAEAGEKEDKNEGKEQGQKRTRWEELKELMSREKIEDGKWVNDWKMEGYLEKRSKANKIRAQLRLGVFPTM